MAAQLAIYAPHALRTNPGTVRGVASDGGDGNACEWSLGLDHAMARNAAARAAYERIYGRPWQSLVEIELQSTDPERHERSLNVTRNG